MLKLGVASIRCGLYGRGQNPSRGSFITSALEIRWSLGWHEKNRNGENEPQQTSWLMFHDTPRGPPNSWVSPPVSTSRIPPSSENEPPTSLWKGEGWVEMHPHLWGKLRGWDLGPHPSIDGKGTVPSFWVWLRANWGGDGGGGMGENKQTSTVMRLMGD